MGSLPICIKTEASARAEMSGLAGQLYPDSQVTRGRKPKGLLQQRFYGEVWAGEVRLGTHPAEHLSALPCTPPGPQRATAGQGETLLQSTGVRAGGRGQGSRFTLGHCRNARGCPEMSVPEGPQYPWKM